MLELRLFGSGRALYDQRPLKGFPEQQPYQLLCYLVLCRSEGRRREQLASLWWPDCSTAVARKHLRNALWRLRQALAQAGVPADAYVRSEGERLSFAPQGPYWLDVEAFEAALLPVRGLPGDTLTSLQVAGMEAALTTYSGPLLEGVYGDWCLVERERLHIFYLDALVQLLAHYKANGAYAQGLACAQRILALDETHEAIHREVMRLHWLMGNPGAALEQYQRCTRVLYETLNVTPSEATLALYHEIMGSRRAERGSAHTPSPTGGASPHDLVGRLAAALRRLDALEDELAEVRAELQDLRRLLGEQGTTRQRGDPRSRHTSATPKDQGPAAEPR